MEHLVRCTVVVLVLGISFGQPRDVQASSVRNVRRDTSYGRPVLAMANSPRCTFNGRPVEDGTTVSSPEPCLNCSCSRGILLCYLHTCNAVAAVPGCEVAKKAGACCPHLECKEPFGNNEYRTERTSEAGYRYNLRQEDGNEQQFDYTSFLEGILPQKRSEGQAVYIQEEDEADDELYRNNSYCLSRGRKYAEGTAMLSPTKCEYCYCIRGQQMCVRPKCHLTVDGCVPRYQSGYTCCPSHYNCDVPSNGSQPVTEDSDSLLPNKVSSCNVEGHEFEVGVAVPSNGHCQTCYCTQIGVVCRRLECSPTVPGCTPVVPEGHCCPTQYKCDPSPPNNTQGPISHSTDNYDVTVLSPGESRTEDPGMATETGMIERAGTEPPSTTTGSEKHKITVELSEEADLESISVIPEENIAVLVLTTEREGEATTTDGRQRTDPSTLPYTDKTSFSTMEDNGITPTVSHEETVKYSEPEEEGKETYAYEYGEYEDVTPDVRQTYSAFSDYTLSTRKDSTDFPESKSKVSYNTPTTLSETTRTTKAGSVDAVTEVNHHPAYTFPNDPARYTIYSTDRTQTSTPSKDIPETLVTKHKLAQKQRRPDIITKHHQTKFSTRPIEFATSTATELGEDRTVPFETTEKRTDTTETHRTKTTPSAPHKKASNRRRLPEGHLTTQPIPQDLADFLLSITQLQQTASSSTETAETLPPIAVAAPKLILEESTPGDVTPTTRSNDETSPPSPNFNFQQPDIIFSNHGPSYNEKPNVPLLINNHKKTSTRLRPPVRFRPSSQTTPSLEDTFVEISNHRPSNRRPLPGKFPPYPHKVNHPPVRNPHIKLHRIEPDVNPLDTPEDYEAYYYDNDREDPVTTMKVFNNINTQHSTTLTNEAQTFPVTASDYVVMESQSSSDHPTNSHINKHAQTFPVTVSDYVVTESKPSSNPPTQTNSYINKYDQTFPPVTVTETQAASSDHPTKTADINKDDDNVVGRSSKETAKDDDDSLVEDTDTTPPQKSTTTPLQSTTTTTTTTTESPVDIHTTKSFSGYVTNKHKGTVVGDAKHSRAEDVSKGKGFIDNRQNEGNNHPSYPENPVLQVVNISQPEEESSEEEISDVCFVDGRYYTSGELIVKSNPCEMCKCFYGHPLCQVQQCPTPPGPSCVLEYLPGYCCPSVTCGITNTEPPQDIVTAPEPTSQEIRPPHIETDNQWKPLPHGPLLRTTERPHKTEQDEKPREPISQEKTTPPPPYEPITSRMDVLLEEIQMQNHQTTTTEPPPPTTNITPEPTTTITPVPTTVTTTPLHRPHSNETADIHDNSSGVRKTLDATVTLPPSKVVVLANSSDVFSTVLPVIMVTPAATTTEDPGIVELVTAAAEMGQVTDLGGNLKVSGCNVYGKYYKINDKVTVLSKQCSDCVCSADGISCTSTC